MVPTVAVHTATGVLVEVNPRSAVLNHQRIYTRCQREPQSLFVRTAVFLYLPPAHGVDLVWTGSGPWYKINVIQDSVHASSYLGKKYLLIIKLFEKISTKNGDCFTL